MLGQPNTQPRTVTKQCKNCNDLFKEEIAGNGTCLGEFCSVSCENEYHATARNRTPEIRCESYCEVCAETHETKWNGATQTMFGQKMWSGFLSHLKHVHCDEDEYPIDMDEKPALYVYDRENEEWKCYDEGSKYWNTVEADDVPEAVRDEREAH